MNLKDSGSVVKSPLFYYVDENHGIDARMQVVDGKFVLLKGSIITTKATMDARADSTIRKVECITQDLNSLIRQGILLPHGRNREGNTGELQEDQEYTTSSGALRIAHGSSMTGGRHWKLEDGRTYYQWIGHQA